MSGPALALFAGLGMLSAHAAPKPRPPEVRYRPGDPLPAIGAEARVDLGLRAAAEELASAALSVDARLSAGAVRAALARAGYPGPARFVSAVSGETLPPRLLDAIPRGRAYDVAWAWRDFSDGRRWWVAGWCERRAQLDPLPRDVAVGGGLGLRVEGVAEGRVLVAPPLGPVVDLALTPDSTRWLRAFSTPGEYRVEVVEHDTIVLLFSVFAGTSLPGVEPLPGPARIEDPVAGAERLYRKVTEYRRALGIPGLARFADFEPATREHAACLGAERVLAHASQGCPGVARLWEREWTPGARHREDLAVAMTADEAWDVTWNSPGHRLNLACTDCTHIAIGGALEPAETPRTTYAIELLQFPSGEPRRIHDWR